MEIIIKSYINRLLSIKDKYSQKKNNKKDSSGSKIIIYTIIKE